MASAQVERRLLRLLAAGMVACAGLWGCTADNPDYAGGRDLSVVAGDGSVDALHLDLATHDQSTGHDALAMPDLSGADLLQCGGSGQMCCGNDQCLDAATTCAGGVCTPCGAAGQPCCALLACGGGTVCRAGSCALCGAAGQPCCGGNLCANNACCDRSQTCVAEMAHCSTGDLCANGQCQQCGAMGQACCKGSTCNDRNACCGANTCVGPQKSCGPGLGVCAKGACTPCGGPGQICCGDACNDGGCCVAAVCVHSGRACAKGQVCLDTQCQACGGDGQPCCVAGGCNGNGCCTSQGRCAKGGDSCGDNCANGSCGTCTMGHCTAGGVPCGGVGDACCVTVGATVPNFCSQRAASCRGGIPGVCQACGAAGQVCCDGNFCELDGCCDGDTCVPGGSNCNKGQCVRGSCGAGSCGSVGQLCCGAGLEVFCSAADSRCDNSACEACGGKGEVACVEVSSNDSIYCDPPYSAVVASPIDICQ